jgi:uncharacterized protein (PEP-CTERM system associated)
MLTAQALLLAASWQVVAIQSASAQQRPPSNAASGPTPESAPAPPSDQAPAAEPSARRAYGYFLSPTIGLRETFTTNAQFGTDAVPERGLITDLWAALAVRILAPQLSVDGTFRLDGYHYVPAHAQDRLLPYGQLLGSWEAAPQHLFLDAGVLSARVANQPFAVVSAVAPNATTNSLTQIRFGPRLEGDVGTGGRYMIRSQNGWTASSSSGANGIVLPGAYSAQNTAELEQRPRPLGAAINAEQDITHFNTPIGATLRDETGRLIARYAPAQELVIGVHGGMEHLNYSIDGRSTGRVVGGDIAWRPSQRTSLVGFGESRPYGFAWDAAFRRRTAFTALELNGYRRLTIQPQSLLGLSGIGDLQRLIEAIYVARYPDPSERAAAVAKLIADTGSQTSTAVPVNSADVAMQSNASATIAYLTPRNVVSLALTELRHDSINIGNLPTALIENSSGAYRDSNIALAYTHWVLPHLAMTAKASFDRMVGLGTTSGNHRVMRHGELQMSEAFSPHLDGLLGVIYQNMDTTVVTSGQQTAVYVGLGYRL